MIVPRPFQKKFKSNYLNFKPNHFIRRRGNKKTRKLMAKTITKETKREG
jgi:hypothetical protein